MIITLPYPDKDLSPNRKNGRHWGVTKAIKDIAINTAYYETKRVYIGKLLSSDPIPLKITFVQSDRYKRDLDNLLAASKPSLDGIAKAIGVDDRLFDPITISRGYDKSKNFMKVEIGE